LTIKVNEPDSLVWPFDKVMVRVSPLATADSVEFGTSKAAVNAAATASCGAARTRQRALIVASQPANNPPFPEGTRPAAKPAGSCLSLPYANALAGPSPAGLHSTRRARVPGAPCSDLRIVTSASQLGQKSDLKPL